MTAAQVTADTDRNKPAAAKLREQEIQLFLNKHGFGTCQRSHLTGDASTRAYELISRQDQPSLILMNAPPQPDGPPIKDGRPYSQIAHLAEDMRAFVGVAQRLQSNGFRVPQIYAQDLDQGLLLIENLGTEGIVTNKGLPDTGRYLAAMETLADIHNCDWETSVRIPDGSEHQLPPFDHDAILIEVDLLAQWYAPYKLGHSLDEEMRHEFTSIWETLVVEIDRSEQSILLRDYHSPNIIWMDGASGVQRTALIDFQDALLGPSAYDVASIAQDARVEISASLEAKLVNHYIQHRHAIDEEQFRRSCAVLAAQRATKVLGIFVRLYQRDKKAAYLAHLPHVERYLTRSVSHPVLADYRDWLKNLIPV